MPTKSTAKANLHVETAIKILGSQTALAKACGVKQGNVWNWLYRDKKITLENAFKIEKATKGKVTQKDMRPDLFLETEETA